MLTGRAVGQQRAAMAGVWTIQWAIAACCCEDPEHGAGGAADCGGGIMGRTLLVVFCGRQPERRACQQGDVVPVVAVVLLAGVGSAGPALLSGLSAGGVGGQGLWREVLVSRETAYSQVVLESMVWLGINRLPAVDTSGVSKVQQCTASARVAAAHAVLIVTTWPQALAAGAPAAFREEVCWQRQGRWVNTLAGVGVQRWWWRVCHRWLDRRHAACSAVPLFGGWLCRRGCSSC